MSAKISSGRTLRKTGKSLREKTWYKNGQHFPHKNGSNVAIITKICIGSSLTLAHKWVALQPPCPSTQSYREFSELVHSSGGELLLCMHTRQREREKDRKRETKRKSARGGGGGGGGGRPAQGEKSKEQTHACSSAVPHRRPPASQRRGRKQKKEDPGRPQEEKRRGDRREGRKRGEGKESEGTQNPRSRPDTTDQRQSGTQNANKKETIFWPQASAATAWGFAAETADQNATDRESKVRTRKCLTTMSAKNIFGANFAKNGRKFQGKNMIRKRTAFPP